MYKSILLFCLLSLCAGCAKENKKKLIDRNTLIDSYLAEDGISDTPIHASELARRTTLDDFEDKESVRQSKELPLQMKERVNFFEAKLADIPFSLGLVPIHEFFESLSMEAENIVLAYVSNQSISELTTFYIEQMPLFDWQKKFDVASIEQILVFEKADRLCVIQLKHLDGWFYQRSKTQLTFFVGTMS